MRAAKQLTSTFAANLAAWVLGLTFMAIQAAFLAACVIAFISK